MCMANVTMMIGSKLNPDIIYPAFQQPCTSSTAAEGLASIQGCFTQFQA